MFKEEFVKINSTILHEEVNQNLIEILEAKMKKKLCIYNDKIKNILIVLTV